MYCNRKQVWWKKNKTPLVTNQAKYLSEKMYAWKPLKTKWSYAFQCHRVKCTTTTVSIRQKIYNLKNPLKTQKKNLQRKKFAWHIKTLSVRFRRCLQQKQKEIKSIKMSFRTLFQDDYLLPRPISRTRKIFNKQAVSNKWQSLFTLLPTIPLSCQHPPKRKDVEGR